MDQTTLTTEIFSQPQVSSQSLGRSTPESSFGRQSPPNDGRNSSLSIYEAEKTMPTRKISLKPRTQFTDPPSIESFATAIDKSLASSIVDFEVEFSKIQTKSFSGHSSNSCSDDLISQDVLPPIETTAGITPEAAQPLSPREADMSSIHKIAFIFVACLAQFLSLGGMNQTVAPVMVLAKYFNIVDYGTLSWFSAAYSMTVGTFILPAGKTDSTSRTLELY
jgi:hypothetical protein